MADLSSAGDRLELGKISSYPETYDPNQLVAIPRKLARDGLSQLGDSVPLNGVDIWTAYEVSWLNPKGVPVVAVARFSIPANSENIVESKSFKLYLNSFNGTKFSDWDVVVSTMTKDLTAAANGDVRVELFSLEDALEAFKVNAVLGRCVDHEDIEVSCYQPDVNLLQFDTSDSVKETLYSNLLKSNCPVTGQPDWATVVFEYQGAKISPASLLAYVVSFRSHQDFHEHCVERMFCDLWETGLFAELSVYARYTRRGGLDINPFRSHVETEVKDVRLVRQ